jgi:cytochrome c peroxidase
MSIERGAMNMNAVSLVDAKTMQWVETVVLDDPDQGAANPWAVAFTREGDRLLVTHAGTHELSVIDFQTLLRRVADKGGATGRFDQRDLHTMAGIRQRVRLPVIGPRALVQTDGVAAVVGYFSNDLALVDLRTSQPTVRHVVLEEVMEASLSRRGEQYFNDASLCFQQWQSCATCHPDGRSDALYWDLLNDGLGNTKNTKSLLMAALTPPVMWRGVRADAGMAVRAGIHHIQFAEPRPDQARAIEAYLASMTAVPSPHLDAEVLERPRTEDASCAKCHYPGVPRGRLTASARRGKVIFEGKGGCATCHPHPTFAAQRKADPGLGSGVSYDIPSLVEVWRTAPYLHGGDALSLHETITDFNFMQRRGKTEDLSDQELEDLLEYLKSL